MGINLEHEFYQSVECIYHLEDNNCLKANIENYQLQYSYKFQRKHRDWYHGLSLQKDTVGLLLNEKYEDPNHFWSDSTVLQSIWGLSSISLDHYPTKFQFFQHNWQFAFYESINIIF